MLGSGMRRRPIKIYDRIWSRGSDGARTVQLSPVSPPVRFGALKSVSSPREVELAKTFVPSAQYTITVLYDDSLNHKQNAIVDGRYYSVAGVVHDPARRESVLYVNQLTDDAIPTIVAPITPSSFPFALPMAIGA
jgi:hypothetical protein